MSNVGFATKMGGILAAAGSAVGLGNIWRFPMEAGQHGGSAFIIVYLLCILSFGLPLLLAEFVIGRRSRANVGHCFQVLAPNTNWKVIGAICVFVAWAILCYYNVVAGWVLYYAFDAVTGNFNELATLAATDSKVYVNHFVDFISNPWMPIVTLLVFMGMTHAVVTCGVEKGIERCSKVLMPCLFLIVLLLATFALNMPGARQGMDFMFTPDFSKIDAKTVLSALGQCFYSLSLGMGIITYASYFAKENNLTTTAITVVVMDTLVAIIAGIIIFPAVFSVPGVEPSAGASLVFIVLPNVFNSALSYSPFLSWFVPVLFYVLLMVAALTSCIFLHEVATAWVAEHLNTTRMRGATIVTAVSIVFGIVCSLSMGPWSSFTICGLNIFDLFDTVTGKFILPVTAFGICAFIGWKMSEQDLIDELSSNGMYKVYGAPVLRFLLKFFAPVMIAVIMVTQLI